MKLVDKAKNVLTALYLELTLGIISYFIIIKWAWGMNFPLFPPSVPTINVLFSGLIVAPFFEEFLFRHAPLSILKNTTIFKDNIWAFIALLGIIFGWMHGSYYNVFLQGIGGVLFGWVYIKNNYCYFSSVIAHFLHNLLILVVVPSLI